MDKVSIEVTYQFLSHKGKKTIQIQDSLAGSQPILQNRIILDVCLVVDLECCLLFLQYTDSNMSGLWKWPDEENINPS